MVGKDPHDETKINDEEAYKPRGVPLGNLFRQNVGAFVFGIEPEINVVLLYCETLVQGFACGAGCNSVEPVPCLFDHFLFELVHI
jgi:hypothetical protein